MMSLLKVAILLAATLAVTCALKPDNEIKAMAKKAFWDPKANEASPGVPPYSFCGGKLAGGDIIVKSYDKSSTGSGTTYRMIVDFRFPASGSTGEIFQRDQSVTIHKAKNGKLTVKSNPCG